MEASSPSTNRPNPELESYVRNALEVGQLLPGANRVIHRLSSDMPLNECDRTLLRILQDAIRDGCIRQVG